VRVDFRVLTFTLAVSTVPCALLGLAPALKTASPDLLLPHDMVMPERGEETHHPRIFREH